MLTPSRRQLRRRERDGKEQEAKLCTEEHESHRRRGGLGEPAQEGQARHHQTGSPRRRGRPFQPVAHQASGSRCSASRMAWTGAWTLIWICSLTGFSSTRSCCRWRARCQTARSSRSSEVSGGGVMMEGDQAGDTGGTAQGCPLSPISSNIMLDDLDRELWQLLHSLQPISNSQCDGRNS